MQHKFPYTVCYNLQAAEEESKETEPEAEAVQTTSTPTPSETTEPESLDRVSTNPDADPVVEGHEPKSASSDNNTTEEENNRTDNDVDEGVDLQGTVNSVNAFTVYFRQQQTNVCFILSSADEQLEDTAKESSEESKGETEASTSPDRGNDSTTVEPTDQGGADKAEVDDHSPGAQNGTDGEEETTKDNTASEATADSTPVVSGEDSVKVLYGKLTL